MAARPSSMAVNTNIRPHKRQNKLQKDGLPCKDATESEVKAAALEMWAKKDECLSRNLDCILQYCKLGYAVLGKNSFSL